MLLLKIFLFTFINAVSAAVVTQQVTVTGLPSSSATDSSEPNVLELKTTIYSSKTVTDQDGDVETTIEGHVSTYLSTGYSQSVVTYTTSVPVTSTYTSSGQDTIVIITTYTQALRTTSCVTSVETSMIVSTVSTERITVVSCADKKCQSTFTSTFLGASESNNGIVTISTLTGSDIDTDSQTSTSGPTSMASGEALTTIGSTSGQSTLVVTRTKGHSESSSSSESASNSLSASRAQTLTFQDYANSNIQKFSLSSVFAVLCLMLV